MFKQQYLIKSYKDFFTIVNQIQKKEGQEILWFRGHENISWRLLPSGIRDGVEFATRNGFRFSPRKISSCANGQQVLLPYVKKTLEEFKKQVTKSNLLSYPVDNDFEWLYLAQHHGIKTPLLDWSDRPDMALYFATKNNHRVSVGLGNAEMQFNESQYVDDAAVVYVLLPGKLNAKSMFIYKGGEDITTPIPVTDENYTLFLNNLYENDFITHIYFCLTAPKFDYRINTQSGNFMWQGTDVQSIDSYIISQEVLYRLIIPYCLIPDIQQQLKEEGITEDYVLGNSRKQTELERIAKEIQNEADIDFKSQVEEITREYEEGIRNNKLGFLKEWYPLGI